MFELQPYESERDLANREAIAEQGIQEQFRFELDLAGEEDVPACNPNLRSRPCFRTDRWSSWIAPNT